MSHHITWRSYVSTGVSEKGHFPIPDDALQLRWIDDGPIYVGRRGEKGEVGEVNEHGNLWTNDQGYCRSGEILCGSPGSVKWVSYIKGDRIPIDAIKAGYYHKDGGDLYIGRDSSGQIGKINTEANGLRNLWCRPYGGISQLFPSSSGEILCAVPNVVKLIYKCIPIYEVQGGASGYVDKEVTISSGLSGSSKEIVSMTDISAKAGLKWDQLSVSATMDTSVKSQMKEACSAYYENRTEKSKIHVDLSKACYVYQAAVIAKMSNGTEINMKHASIIQRSQPILESEYQIDI